jgi:hypothetical protein
MTPQSLYPREGGVVAPTGIEFRWTRVPGPLCYDVRVVTEEGDVVWEGRAGDSLVGLPSNVHLTADESFFVRVRALLPEGKTVTSRMGGFKVKGPT